jgi:hypothetical protein
MFSGVRRGRVSSSLAGIPRFLMVRDLLRPVAADYAIKVEGTAYR